MRGIKIDDLPERYREQVNRQLASAVRLSSAVANLEQDSRNEPLGPQEASRYYGPTRIRLIEYRHRQTDFDGSSCKYLVDALVTGKVLLDDNPNYVAKIEKEQIKIPIEQPEKTIVEIWKA